MSIPLGLAVITLIFLIVNNIIIGNKILPFKAYITHSIKETNWYYLKTISMLIWFYPLILFFGFGLFCLFQRNSKIKILLLSWLIIFILISSIVSVQELRYALIVLPAIILTTGLGVEQFLQKCVKTFSFAVIIRWLILGYVVLWLGLKYPYLEKYMKAQNQGYLYFRETGEWIKSHLRPNSLILASSPRQVRYFSGSNFQQYGGKVIEEPFYITNLENIVATYTGHIIVEIDNWGGDNEVIHPVSKKEIHFLEEKGFKLVQEIGQRLYLSPSNTIIYAPAIWLLERQSSE